MEYDVIIVGSNSGALVSALKLVKEKKKVLLLEENNNISSVNKCFNMGRFEFDTVINPLYLDSNDHKYNIITILNELGIDVTFTDINNKFYIYVGKDKIERIELSFGIEDFINDIDKIYEGSKERLELLFDLALECKEALNYISEGNVNNEVIKDKYSNYMRVGSYSFKKVCESLNVKKDVRELLESLWIYLGSPSSDLSFVHYAVFFREFIDNGLSLVKGSTSDIDNRLLFEYERNGGEIIFNKMVNNLIIKNNKVLGVKLTDGSVYYADDVIVSSNMINVYNKLIKVEDTPEDAIKHINACSVGCNSFSVYLGLNRSAKELGLDNNLSFIYGSLDSNKEFSNLSKIDHYNMIVNVIKKVGYGVKNNGTCMLNLTTILDNKVYGKYVTSDNELDIKEDYAFELINRFEEVTGIDVIPFIEEIKIVTPIDYVKNNYQGNVYGFRYTMDDNLIGRMLNCDKENYIKGLYIIDGFNGDAYLYESSYYKGYVVASKIINR